MGRADNVATIEVGFAEPRATTQTLLSEGVYSLAARSNVPFVTLVGSAGFRKTFTWGEIAEVPRGQMVTVRNASYHAGDIVINRGADYDNRPARITVPVELEVIDVPLEEGSGYRTKFPVDARMARRAFLCVDASVLETAAYDVLFYRRGRRLDGSMKTTNLVALYDFNGVFEAMSGTGYLDYGSLGKGDSLSRLPLGKGSIPGDNASPHFLLDGIDAALLTTRGEGGVSENLIRVPDFDFGPNLAPDVIPPCWYLLEY